MPPLTVRGKAVTFVMVLMTADSQVGKRDIEGFSDNHYPTTPQQSNSLAWKSLKRTLKNFEKDTEA